MEKTIDLIEYSQSKKLEWNLFISNSRSNVFMFNRAFMDYHADRFQDNSLMFYKNKKLIAVLPANLSQSVLYSHQGLSFGGLLLSNSTSIFDVLHIFDRITVYCKNNDILKLVYKAIPFIYHQKPMQEDLYALFRLGAKRIGCNLSSTIFLNEKLAFTESRKSGVRKARNASLNCKESVDFKAFWEILNENLTKNHGVKPVHSLSEIVSLHAFFPNEIKLFLCFEESKPVAGSVLFISHNVVHVQYISANDIGKQIGALDLLFDYLINNFFDEKYIFDFGHSNENGGQVLNEGLIFQKEGFGGRGHINEVYEIEFL
jgi:hypothetical protein